MMRFALRRWRNLIILLCVSVVTVIVYTVYWLQLRHTGFITGWTLFLLMLALAGYNARKKLPFLPLVSSANWLQFHLYAGFFTFVLFLLHVRFRVPAGTLEVILAGLYCAVFGSGIVGLGLSRAIPARLTTRGEEVIFERVPMLRRRLGEELEGLIARAVASTASVTLPDFYARRLLAFFEGPRHFWWHLAQSNRPVHTLLNELLDSYRYLSAAEQKIADEIADLIRIKDDLDYHSAHQALLKYWLFVHIPLTYSLLLVALLHGVMVYAFLG